MNVRMYEKKEKEKEKETKINGEEKRGQREEKKPGYESKQGKEKNKRTREGREKHTGKVQVETKFVEAALKARGGDRRMKRKRQREEKRDMLEFL